MTSDDRMTWGLILEVMDVLERHGYHRHDNQHTGQAVEVIFGLTRVYEGTQDIGLGSSAIPVPELSPATAPPTGPAASQGAISISAAQATTIAAALDIAADYQRDRAGTCPDCVGQSCASCQSRLQDAQAYGRVAADLLSSAHAAALSQPEPQTSADPRPQPHQAACREAGQ
jgi:hypothetical protein